MFAYRAHTLLLLLGVALIHPSTSAADKKAPDSPASQWWGYVSNGDKPGNGYLLTVKDGLITQAEFYIVSPDESGKFVSGRKIAMKFVSRLEKKTTFTIELPGDEENVDIVMQGPALQGEWDAVVCYGKDDSEGRRFHFVPAVLKAMD